MSGVEIKVFVLPYICHSLAQSSAAIVTDRATGKSFIIHFPVDTRYKTYEKNEKTYLHKATETVGAFSTPPITLYSDKNFDDFIEAYLNEFGPTYRQTYNYVDRHCAAAVDFMLNHFFPDAETENKLHFIFQVLCCIGWVASLGTLYCFPPPYPLKTPFSVYEKAGLLSVRHGRLTEAMEEELLEQAECEDDLEERDLEEGIKFAFEKNIKTNFEYGYGNTKQPFWQPPPTMTMTTTSSSNPAINQSQRSAA
ncbi:MAG TPA: hypothetical protein VHZ76_00400 [Gammaproteobacteria bacterium]|jgi:hypothetical protein|nr:hypothetical protein [Gammaproteobacteria bacterium]